MKCRLLALAASFFCVCSFTGCNGVGPKESLLAKINDESIYEEDLVYLLQSANENKETPPLGQNLYENLYSGSALVSRALKEFPDLENDWSEMKSSLEARWLTLLFRGSYLSDCMGTSETVLRRYSGEHPGMFKQDSLTGFAGIRREVAGEYYISVNKSDYDEFLKSELALLKTPSSEDSLNAKRKYLNARRSELDKEYAATILEKQNFKLAELPPVDPQKYYEKNKDLYMTVPGYDLYMVQSPDSLFLSNIVVDSANYNHIGVVKVGYPLPYGIGMLPDLDAMLEGKSAGFVTPVIRGANNVFYRFYLAAVVPSSLKPYDRVKTGIEMAIANGELLEVDSSTVLIYHNGTPFYTEADLLLFNDRFVKRRMTKRSHEWLSKMLAEHFAFAEAAKALKLDHEWEYRALVRSARLEFFTEHYLDRLSLNISDKDAKAWYDRMLAADNPLTDFESVKDRVKQMAVFPANLIKRDYYMGYNVMYKGRSLEQSYQSIFERRFSEHREKLKARLKAEAYNSARIHLYDSSIPEYKPQGDVNRWIASADSLYKAGNLDDAFLEYRSIMFTYADADSVFSRVTYNMAEIRNETNQFHDAEEEYYAFYRNFPKNPNAEKAMFSRGFILNENLHKDSLAAQVFDEFLKTYPNSEFKESAQWLLDNIRSNGKLQEELNKKIATEDGLGGDSAK